MANFSRVSPKPLQVLLAVVSVFFLVACGGGGGGDAGGGGGGGGGGAASSPDSVKLTKASQLRIVPFCELNPSMCGAPGFDISKWLVYGRLTGFGLSGKIDGSISITGAGDFFPGFSLSLPLTLNYDSASSQWVSKPAAVGQGSVRIAIDENVDLGGGDGVIKASYLMVCNAAGECTPYALAQPIGMCRLVTDAVTKKVDDAMLMSINGLQTKDLQVNCPIDFGI